MNFRSKILQDVSHIKRAFIANDTDFYTTHEYNEIYYTSLASSTTQLIYNYTTNYNIHADIICVSNGILYGIVADMKTTTLYTLGKPIDIQPYINAYNEAPENAR